MQDVFIEYMVKKRATGKEIILKILISFAGGILTLAALLFSNLLGPLSFLGALIAVGSLYGAYYLITSMNLEFEYAVTNGELDVDKIIAQRRRKRLINVKCREVEGFGRYKESEHAQKSYQTKVFACDLSDTENLWYFVSRQKEKGLTLLVFNANQKMLDGIKPFLPKPIMHEAFRHGQS